MADQASYGIFGCDIGNGFGYISLLEDVDENPIPMFPANYRLEAEGMPTSAYIVPPDGTQIEVFQGRSAYDRHRDEPDKFVHAIKTRLAEVAIPMPGISRPVSVFDVYGAVARDLVRLGNEERARRGEEPLYELAFTFPASFSENPDLLNRMQESIERVSLDGHPLKVRGRLPEPAAVAVDYLYYLQHLAPEKIRLKGDSYTALVYDLGYGTFDTAVVTARSKGEPYELHMSDGLSDVGGKDFDQALYDMLCSILKTNYRYVPRNPNEQEFLRTTAIAMKHELTDGSVSTRSLTLPGQPGAELGGPAIVEITREQFEAATRNLLHQTLALVDQMLRRAKDERIPIDAVVLSGGASLMPMVREGLEKLLAGEDLAVQIYRPSRAVSYGAARFASGKAAASPEGGKGGDGDESKQKGGEEQTGSSKGSTVVEPQPVLESYTEYAYGIWIPSQDVLSAGNMMVLVPPKAKLPATSEPVTIANLGTPLKVRLYQSREKYASGDVLDAERDALPLQHFMFDIPEGCNCDIRVIVEDDFDVSVTCEGSHFAYGASMKDGDVWGKGGPFDPDPHRF